MPRSRPARWPRIGRRPAARPPGPVAGPAQGRGGPGGRPGFRPGTRIASAGAEVAVIQPDGRGVSLLDAATGALADGGDLRLFDRPGQPPREVVSLAASAEGDRLVTVDHPLDIDGPRRGGRFEFSVHLWDTTAPGKPLATLYEPPGSAGELTRGGFPLVAISPDGTTVAVATTWFDPEIAIWTRDGKSRATIDSQSQLSALAIGPSGLLAAAGNRAVHLWDLARPGSSLTSLTPDIGRVDQLRFGRENRALLAVGGPSDVELWDVGAMARVAKLPTVEGGFGIPLALGGRTLALGLPSSLTLWSVVDPKVQAQIAGFRGGPASVAFSGSGELAMASNDGEVRLWTTGRCPTTARAVETLRANALAFDARGLLLAQGRDALAWLDDAGREVARAALPRAPARGGQRGGDSLPPTSGRVARSADGRTIVVTRGREIFLDLLKEDGSPAPIVKLMPDGPEPAGPDRPQPDPPPGPRGRGDGPRSWRDLALSPDGRRLFLTSFEEAGGWAIDGDRLRRLSWPFPARASRLAMAPDGRTIAVGCDIGPAKSPTWVVLLIDIGDGRVRHRIDVAEEGAGGFVTALAFSPDGRELAVGSREQIRLWSLAGKEPAPFVRLTGHHGFVSVLAYDPGGRRLASGSLDGTVKVWDVDHVRDELAGLGLD